MAWSVVVKLMVIGALVSFGRGRGSPAVGGVVDGSAASGCFELYGYGSSESAALDGESWLCRRRNDIDLSVVEGILSGLLRCLGCGVVLGGSEEWNGKSESKND